MLITVRCWSTCDREPRFRVWEQDHTLSVFPCPQIPSSHVNPGSALKMSATPLLKQAWFYLQVYNFFTVTCTQSFIAYWQDDSSLPREAQSLKFNTVEATDIYITKKKKDICRVKKQFGVQSKIGTNLKKKKLV